VVNVKLCATKIALSLVAVASLSVAGAGAAGAASQAGTQPASHASVSSQHRLCVLGRGHKGQAARIQAGFAAVTAKFAALEAKAQQAGDTKLAAYWKSVVDHRTATLAKRQARTAARWAHPGPWAARAAGAC
jgi:hypothetical protein